MIQYAANPECTAAAPVASRPVPAPGFDASLPAAGEVVAPPSALPAAPDPTPKPDCPTLFPQAGGESERAFEAFRAYLELGPKRRYAAVGRKVGASLRTVKRWARDFDWRGRIKTCAARCAEQYAETESILQRDELLDAAARARTFRDRQYALAQAILAAAQRHLERVEDDDLDQMNFGDACKALEVASRLGQRAGREADDPSAPARSLRDQLTALLDQVCGDAPSPLGPARPPDLPPRSAGSGIKGQGQPQASTPAITQSCIP